MLNVVLLALAFVCCLVAAFWYPPPQPKPHLGWLGMAFYFLSLLLGLSHVVIH